MSTHHQALTLSSSRASKMTRLLQMALLCGGLLTAQELVLATNNSSDIDNDGYLQPASPLKPLPKQVKLNYQVFYGSLMAGSSQLNWQQQGNRYQLETIINPIIGPKLRYVSAGQIQANIGLVPDKFQAWRGDQERELARFYRLQKMLTYGEQGDKQLTLKPGAQDIFSLPFQLALKGKQLGNTPVQITTGKKVYEYPLQLSEESDYDTGDGKIRVTIFRAKGDGDINEYWLASDFANLPVRIRRISQDKQIDFKITRIEVNGESQWQLPTQSTKRNSE
ncbi:DUF3108 domain-containing protein [Neisseriaceae bacterium TC5R-5]|nr:DUF3108 domain-containing protein [Neisseriaceae bacterium TC5R-5]